MTQFFPWASVSASIRRSAEAHESRRRLSRKQFKVIGNFPEPRIESLTQIKSRMLDVGICCTDKDIVHFQYGTPPEGSPYLVIGHESLGEVVETGAEVSDIHKGDLIVLSVRRPCNHHDCIACRSGRQDFCYTGDFTERGIKERHGYMTEMVVEDAQYAFLVSRELRDVAVLVAPPTIAEKGVEQLLSVQQRLISRIGSVRSSSMPTRSPSTAL